MQDMDPVAYENLKNEELIHGPYSSKHVNGTELVLGEKYRIFTRAVNFSPTMDGGNVIYVKRENGYNYFQTSNGNLVMYSNRDLGRLYGNTLLYKYNDLPPLVKVIQGGKKFIHPFKFFFM